MRQIGYLILLNREFPTLMSLSPKLAVKVTKKIRPSAVKRVAKIGEEEELFYFGQLASIMAQDDKESKAEILQRVRTTLDLHWRSSTFEKKKTLTNKRKVFYRKRGLR